ncbi:unnamed protein product [Pedinophyceae sp. YPF-701]|nr:unnamed protein product [Pedinophyceae sp. YPF-701]
MRPVTVRTGKVAWKMTSRWVALYMFLAVLAATPQTGAAQTAGLDAADASRSWVDVTASSWAEVRSAASTSSLSNPVRITLTQDITAECAPVTTGGANGVAAPLWIRGNCDAATSPLRSDAARSLEAATGRHPCRLWANNVADPPQRHGVEDCAPYNVLPGGTLVLEGVELVGCTSRNAEGCGEVAQGGSIIVGQVALAFNYARGVGSAFGVRGTAQVEDSYGSDNVSGSRGPGGDVHIWAEGTLVNQRATADVEVTYEVEPATSPPPAAPATPAPGPSDASAEGSPSQQDTDRQQGQQAGGAGGPGGDAALEQGEIASEGSGAAVSPLGIGGIVGGCVGLFALVVVAVVGVRYAAARRARVAVIENQEVWFGRRKGIFGTGNWEKAAAIELQLRDKAKEVAGDISRYNTAKDSQWAAVNEFLKDLKQKRDGGRRKRPSFFQRLSGRLSRRTSAAALSRGQSLAAAAAEAQAGMKARPTATGPYQPARRVGSGEEPPPFVLNGAQAQADRILRSLPDSRVARAALAPVITPERLTPPTKPEPAAPATGRGPEPQRGPRPSVDRTSPFVSPAASKREVDALPPTRSIHFGPTPSLGRVPGAARTGGGPVASPAGVATRHSRAGERQRGRRARRHPQAEAVVRSTLRTQKSAGKGLARGKSGTVSVHDGAGAELRSALSRAQQQQPPARQAESANSDLSGAVSPVA